MNRYSVTVQSAPPAEPLTLAEAKLHLRVDSDITADDALISALIIMAREWVENYCRRSMVQRTLELRMDCWPRVIRLPRGPVISVTSVKYVDSGGTLTTLSASNYQVDLYSTPARITPLFGEPWPVPKLGELNAIVVRYVAGYADDGASPTDYTANIPETMLAAMKLIMGHLYENRELAAAVQLYDMPFAVKALLAQHEIRDFALE